MGIAITGENMDPLDSHALLVGMQNDTTTLENHLAVAYNDKHTLTIDF